MAALWDEDIFATSKCFKAVRLRALSTKVIHTDSGIFTDMQSLSQILA